MKGPAVGNYKTGVYYERFIYSYIIECALGIFVGGILHYNKKEKLLLKRPVIETIVFLVIYVLVYIFTEYKTDVIVDGVLVGLLFVGFVVIKNIRK